MYDVEKKGADVCWRQTTELHHWSRLIQGQDSSEEAPEREGIWPPEYVLPPLIPQSVLIPVLN